MRKKRAMKVGDAVTRCPEFMVSRNKQPVPMQGQVIWIHPRGRFHVVEFRFRFGSVRECFMTGDANVPV